MAITAHNMGREPLTYEQYMAEGEVNQRYEILEGVRLYMANPTRRHQIVAGNLYAGLRGYERATQSGKALFAPCDVLITRSPLRTRQPDVLLISNEQLARCGADTDPTAMEAAPELVVEILSPSETSSLQDSKIQDYCRVGVRECWVVHIDNQTVTVLRLNPEGAESAALYTSGQSVISTVFPDLALALTDIFAP